MADENLHGLPISSLPKADELNQTDQLIAYREDDGKAYRSNVGALAEASTANIGDAFATTVQYNAGDYCIYNDTLYKFTDFKDIGSWDDSVVEKVTVADEIKSNTEKIQENTDLIERFLICESFTRDDISIPYNTTSTQTFDVSKDGYTPLAIAVCGVDNASTSGGSANYCYIFNQVLSGNTVRIAIKHMNTSGSNAVVMLTVTILYKADM